MISDRDEDALSYMTSLQVFSFYYGGRERVRGVVAPPSHMVGVTLCLLLQVEEFGVAQPGCRIRFFFAINPYFQNRVVAKEFVRGPSGGGPSAGVWGVLGGDVWVWGGVLRWWILGGWVYGAGRGSWGDVYGLGGGWCWGWGMGDGGERMWHWGLVGGEGVQERRMGLGVSLGSRQGVIWG